MLSKKEVESLKPGEYPNHVLRMKFGDKHGTPVTMRFRKNELVDGEPVFEDHQIIGNRFQSRFMKRNPLAELPDRSKPTYQSNRLNTKKNSQGGFKRIIEFLKNMFKFMNYAQA